MAELEIPPPSGTAPDGADGALGGGFQDGPESPARSDLSMLVAALFPAREDLPRVPQQARSREKRAEILKAAARLFGERGYAGTTSDDIAQAAGVSVGTFYNYFRNKRQVLVTLVIERLEDIFTDLQLARIDFACENRRETIRTAIGAVLNRSHSALRRVWQELMSHEPELVPYQQLIRRHTLAKLEENLRRAVRHGGTWPNLDVEVTALAIFNLLDTMGLRPEQNVADERLMEGLTDIVYRAVFPPEQTR
jgi:TetR/AcrR family transcriptional repressor of mexJK operon